MDTDGHIAHSGGGDDNDDSPRLIAGGWFSVCRGCHAMTARMMRVGSSPDVPLCGYCQRAFRQGAISKALLLRRHALWVEPERLHTHSSAAARPGRVSARKPKAVQRSPVQ